MYSRRAFREDLSSIDQFAAMRAALDPDYAPAPSAAQRVLNTCVEMAGEVQTIAAELRLARAENALANGQCTIGQIALLVRQGQSVTVHPFK